MVFINTTIVYVPNIRVYPDKNQCPPKTCQFFSTPLLPKLRILGDIDVLKSSLK